MTTTTLRNAMPIVATALGRKFGVQVQVGGQQAATDGQTIWLPDLPADSELRPVAWGLLAHEASHVRHTDMTVYRAAARHSPLRRHLLNLLEDIRVELAIRRDYPGTETTLARVIDWMLADGRLDPPTPKDHPARILTDALLLILRHRVLGQPALAVVAQDAERVLRQTFPPSLVHRLFGLLAEVRGLGSTAAAADLARRIERLLDEEARAHQPVADPSSSSEEETDITDTEGSAGTAPGEDDPAPDEGQPDGSYGQGCEQAPSDVGEAGSECDASQEACGEAEGRHCPAGAPDRASESSDSGNPWGTEVADVSSDSEGQRAGALSGDEASSKAATNDVLRRVLVAGEGDLTDDLFTSTRQALAIAAGDTAVGTPKLPVGEDPPCHPRWGEWLRRQVEGTSRQLIARLQGLVQSRRLDRPHAVCRGRTLVPARLHRAAVGDARLFARRRPRSAPNTALHLLVDLSGSMRSQTGSGQRAFRVALDTALALALALERIPGVSVAVSAFPGQGGEDERITRLVQHGQSVRLRAGAFRQDPRGGTPLAQALWYAAADLTLRAEFRRVIVVMTDGVPNDWAATVAILRLCESNGIEPVGIGIACDVSALFQVRTRVEEAGDLKQALFGLAERLLI